MKSFLYAIGTLLVSLFFFPTPSRAAAPVRIIFDSDMGNDVDDVFALDILLKYHDMGKVNILGMPVNHDAPSAAAFIDLYNTWCGHPEIPLAIIRNGVCTKKWESTYSYKVWQLEENGRRVFRTTHADPRAFPDAVDLYRRLLAQSPNKSVVIVSTGFSSTLARLMDTTGDDISPLGGMELLRRKVSWISVMAGDFQRPDYPENNVKKDIPAAQKFFEHSPVPLVFTDFLLGESIRYPASSIERDFNWTKHHPLAEAYRAYRKMPYDRPTWDPLAMLYALEPDGGFFQLSERGNVTVTQNGCTHFHPSPTGNCRYLTVTDAQRRKILDFFTTLVPQRPRHCTARR
ncbi:MAG: nucleoside hydrolase [Bacteroidaceae bacterium]|nr:nucleoside hydrolase [Bacteroidaceae bacterium]